MTFSLDLDVDIAKVVRGNNTLGQLGQPFICCKALQEVAKTLQPLT